MALLVSCANTNPDEDVDAALSHVPVGNEKPAEQQRIIPPLRNVTRPPKSVPIPAGTRFYLVCKGDTLHSISKRSRLDFMAIAKWNDLQPPYQLYAGQNIKLFNPEASASSTPQPKKTARQPSQKVTKKQTITSEQMQKNKNTSQKKLIFSTNKEKMLKFYCQWPVNGKVLKKFSESGNKGIDIGANHGQPVKAAAAGKVVFSGQGLRGYGNLLIIEHSAGFLSAYGNNSKLLVKKGQQVEQGGTIAEAGESSGHGAVLHFELRKNGKPVNPMEYLPN